MLPIQWTIGVAAMIDHIMAWLGAQLRNGIFASGAALGVAGGAVALVHRLLPWLNRILISAITTSVSVDSRSSVFEPLLIWLHHHPYADRCRRLTVTMRETEDTAGARELIFTPAVGSHFLGYHGFPIWLERRVQKAEKDPLAPSVGPSETLHLTALGRDRRILRQLIEDAVDRFGRDDPTTTVIYGVDEYLDWDRLSRIHRRPIDSVVLPDGVVEDLVADAARFLAGAAWHIERGIPWRRGYLLYGPPGTGKTSLVKALAGALDLDVAVVNLTSPRLNDTGLCKLFAEAPRRSVLLMEDVDAAFSLRTRQEVGSQVTFSGLLNAVDGVMSQEGHLLFMTTNHLERLDPALIRPGRVDVRLETCLADPSMARRMFLIFFPDQLPLADCFATAFATSPASTAAIQAYLLIHRDDAAAAVRELREWLAQMEHA